jgi:hypothetical protein
MYPQRTTESLYGIAFAIVGNTHQLGSQTYCVRIAQLNHVDVFVVMLLNAIKAASLMGKAERLYMDYGIA